MILDTQKLRRVNTYAKEKGVTSAMIYKAHKSGKVNIIKIDGMQFVDVEKSSYKPNEKKEVKYEAIKLL